MPLPSRKRIKAALISLLRQRGTVSPSEAYTFLANAWGLSIEERTKRRGGRPLYEHEIRWARQELVIDGVIQTTDATGRAAWRLIDSARPARPEDSAGPLSRMIEGFLQPDQWFLVKWLPRYERAVAATRNAIANGRIDEAVDAIWLQPDNSVSNAGRGILAAQEVEARREYFRVITHQIAQNPDPATFDRVLKDAERQRALKRLSKVPRLLIARAFASLAPERYHTTVDYTKHERVLSWFEKHTSFRATPGNWAHRASELSLYLSGVIELGPSVLVRNMFPWFIFSQLTDRHGRPPFTPGHRPRARTGAGREQPETELVQLRHNALVGALFEELIDEHSRTAVGTEQPSGMGGFVDAVVKLAEKRYWIYEVKVATSASDAIRQALGQLLEYAYRQGAWNPERLYVVAEAILDAESRTFLRRLCSDFGIPIQYRQIVVPGHGDTPGPG